MKNSLFIITIICLALLSACKKGEITPERSFINVTVISKPLVNVPDVSVFVDGVLLDTLTKGGAITKLLAKDDKLTMSLSVRDLQTGAHLLDSVFTVKPINKFTILIDRTLGLTTFYTPSDKIIPADSGSIQFFCNSVVGSQPGRRLRFKLFTSLDYNVFDATPYESVVESGQLAAPFVLPLKNEEGKQLVYFVQILDAVTDEVLLSPTPGYTDSQVIIEPRKNSICQVVVVNLPEYGGDFYDQFQYYPF